MPAAPSADRGETWTDLSAPLIKFAEQPHLKSNVGGRHCGDCEGMLDSHAIVMSVLPNVKGKRSANDTLAPTIVLRRAAVAYAVVGTGATTFAAAGSGDRQLCGSSCARSRCLSVGRRSKTSVR